MNITVILCTFNRSQSLAKALASVAACTLPASTNWEVLVVDNNSTDQTRAVIEGFQQVHGDRFRYLFEPKSGKSHALNSGIRASQGEILAFMDDDVEVEPGWLANLTASLENAELAGTGGRILPAWTSTPPPWIPAGDRYGLAPLAMFDLGTQPGPLNEAPFGTNMAFRKSIFEKYGFFRTDLGPRPGSEIRNEDTEFGSRVLAAGEKLRYEPLAVVHHSVSQSRLTRQYFLTWWFDKARADVREFSLNNANCLRLLGIPLVSFRRLVVWTVRWMVSLNPARRFSAKLKVWSLLGGMQECYRLAHHPPQ